MSTALDVDEFIFGLLNPDPALTGLAPGGVHESLAPTGVSYPHVVVSPGEPIDRRAADSGGSVLVVGEWVVKAVDQSGSYPAATYDRIHELLEGAEGAAGVSRVYLRRIATIAYPETDQGIEYRHHGGRYQAWAHPTP